MTTRSCVFGVSSRVPRRHADIPVWSVHTMSHYAKYHTEVTHQRVHRRRRPLAPASREIVPTSKTFPHIHSNVDAICPLFHRRGQRFPQRWKSRLPDYSALPLPETACPGASPLPSRVSYRISPLALVPPRADVLELFKSAGENRPYGHIIRRAFAHDRATRHSPTPSGARRASGPSTLHR